jgi:hypothetical protein
MMTGRAWFLGSDLAGVVTAMITYKGRARALPTHHQCATRLRVTPKDFADSLGKPGGCSAVQQQFAGRLRVFHHRCVPTPG